MKIDVIMNLHLEIKGNPVCLQVFRTACFKLNKLFIVSRGRCNISDKCPHVMSLESLQVEDLKKKQISCWRQKEVSRPAAPLCSRLHNRRSSCIVGNVVARF